MRNNRIAIITGAYGAIGKAIAEGIAIDKRYEVVLVGRNENSLIDVASDIEKKTMNHNVSYEVVDLSRKTSIQELANRWNGPLHVLVNNAATTPRQRMETLDGIEMQLATNVLGYMWMMEFMNKFMVGINNARIVNVASYWAGGLNFDDLEFKHRLYNNDSAYRQSKQADRMLSAYFSNKLAPLGIKVVACHPGDVNSKLSNNLGFGGHEPPESGAATPVWLAVSEQDIETSGKYFENKRQVSCGFSKDKLQLERLYHICRSY